MSGLLMLLILSSLETGCNKSIKRNEVHYRAEPTMHIATRDTLAFYLTKYFSHSEPSNPEKFVVNSGFMRKVDGKFFGNDTLKRYKFTIVLTRIIFALKLETYYEDISLPRDIDTISYYYYTAKLVMGLHLLKPVGGLFMPERIVTSEEVEEAVKKIRGYYEMDSKE